MTYSSQETGWKIIYVYLYIDRIVVLLYFTSKPFNLPKWLSDFILAESEITRFFNSYESEVVWKKKRQSTYSRRERLDCATVDEKKSLTRCSRNLPYVIWPVPTRI